MKIPEFLKSHKKAIAGALAAVLVVSAAGGFGVAKTMGAQSTEEEVATVTIPVTKQNLEKTLNATGTIISCEESSVTANTTESYPVAEVYVKVGDVVKKGDALYKLDMSSFEEELEYKKKAAELDAQSKALEKAEADRQYSEAQKNGQNEINEANNNLTQAQSDAQNAAWAQQSATGNLDGLKNKEKEAKKSFEKSEKAYNKIAGKVEDVKKSISTLTGEIDDLKSKAKDASEDDKATIQDKISKKESELAELNSKAQELNTEYETAKADYDKCSQDYEQATASRTEGEQALADANEAASTAAKSVASAENSVKTASDSANSSVASQANAVKSAEVSAQTEALTKEQEEKKNARELEKATVYATQDGTVTNVNVKVGNTYTGTDAVVIDDVNNLKATADIDEAQISNVKTGQRVQIKTDATGDEILQGTVSFVSPTPTKNSSTNSEGESSTASVSKSRATYRVDVDLDSANETLRLGMTAKMTFILESSEEALAVPSADIMTAEDGSKYVTVLNDDGTTEDVYVETGMETDFYTEITGGSLTEGMNVVESGYSDGTGDAMVDGMDADGGIVIE
ncbi:MAG: efflux RND transporter periplasmic adaptor subunit [Lachnospiraceae bacterium]|nr:efflux RND transporter periplasmic adaptor subunit [Lachnospiraceae bacterium]